MDYSKYIIENEKRLNLFTVEYNQLTGYGSLVPRKNITYIGSNGQTTLWLPIPIFEDPIIQLLDIYGSIAKIILQAGDKPTDENIAEIEDHIATLRLDNDFEYWAITCATIQDKITKSKIPFKLNRAQRRLIAALEKMRVAGKPIRLILLKARQWGGSTTIQMYMAWIQLRRRKAWHSTIVADVDDQARNIRNMYTKLTKSYPPEINTISWRPYEGGSKAKIIPERECIIGIGSAQKPESLRSNDFAMLHLSEVGLWKDTMSKTAADLAQSLQSTVPDAEETLVVLESTAKGVGNFFHKQWISAEKGDSIYVPFFVPWFEIEMYRKEVPNYIDFIKTWGEYHYYLWELGATIEGIYWYFSTKIGYGFDDWRMMSEYPSTAKEAFQSSGRRAFAPRYVEMARKSCFEPEFVGDVFPTIKGPESIKNPTFDKIPKGNLRIWSMPDNSIKVTNRYCAFVDIGGRSKGADYSVIKVFDRYWMIDNGIPEVAAVWHGHIDQDLLAWKAVQICKLYNNALLAIETNSLRRLNDDGDHFLTILDEIANYYENLYARIDHEKISVDMPKKYGFHTNKSTKVMIIDALNAALRDGLYTERDLRACDEMDTYEIKPNGSYGAIDGEHDDHVIVTAGGVWLSYDMEPPKIIDEVETARRRSAMKTKVKSEATI